MEYGTINILTTRSLGLIAGLGVWLGVAAGTTFAQDYGFDWVTIGDPGNRDTLPHEMRNDPDSEIGGVAYEYRITRSNIGTLDYLEFARAYVPYYEGQVDRRGFLGQWLTARPDGFGGWIIGAANGTEGYAASITWEMAARYTNWLHNGKVNEKWAFENGVYDSSTFYYDSDNGYQHQAEHHPDAKFWLPTVDEYAKAAYWDPDKDGGEGGYWVFPDSDDRELFAALPEDGGETIGDTFEGDNLFYGAWDMNQYPDTITPWGLLDVSGTMPGWLESYSNSRGSRMQGGSLAHDVGYSGYDRIDIWGSGAPHHTSLGGLRLVAAVPAPGGLGFVGVMYLILLRKERNR